jgi:hypothetical protein
MTQILRKLLSQSRRNADIPLTRADHQLIGCRLWSVLPQPKQLHPLLERASTVWTCGQADAWCYRFPLMEPACSETALPALHSAPDVGCDCGLHAFDTLELAVQEATRRRDRKTVLEAIVAWGKGESARSGLPSAPQFGMSTSGGRAVRRPIPRWRRRVGGHRDG